MHSKLSLTMRAFLLGFFPVCVMLAASFFTIHATVRAKIKDGLKDSLRRTEKALDVANADYNRRNNQLLVVLSEDSGLKAGIGLLREVPYGGKSDQQGLQMVRDQLHEIAGIVDYDLLILVDTEGKPVTGFVGKSDGVPLDSMPISPDLYPFIRVQGTLYETTTVPINLGAENLGGLMLGRKFDIGSFNSAGFNTLVSGNKILASNFPGAEQGDLERQLQTRCGSDSVAGECEIRVGGEDYLAARVQKARFGDRVQLYTVQSIDAAVNEFTRGLRNTFLVTGAGGVLLVLLFSAFGSRSISQPLTDLIGHLNESERTGRMESDFSVQSSVVEVNRLGKAFNRAAEAIQESRNRLEKADLEFIETMAQMLDARDPCTAGHSNRVSVNAMAVAETMRLPSEQVEIIRIGGQLHDVGKIGVPDAVLQKPGKLTAEEYALIKLHPQIGKKILENLERFREYLPIVELHHENFDGSGYPYGLKGHEVPLGVRIVHVVDVYDAITSNRAYRKAMTEERVREIMLEGSGQMFDPAVIEAFMTLLSERRVLEEVLSGAGMVDAQS